MDGRRRAIVGSLVLAAVLGCGGASEGPPAPEPDAAPGGKDAPALDATREDADAAASEAATAHESGDATVAPREGDPPGTAPSAAPLASVRPPDPPGTTVALSRIGELPEFSDGKPIRLTGPAIGERKVGKRKLPTVAIADLASRQRLDELIEDSNGRCKVLLALETLVSMRCQFFDEMSEAPTHDAWHFRVGTAGDVERIDVWSLLHPGLSRLDLIPVLMQNPKAGDRTALLTKTGLELADSMGENEPALVPWRAIAPYVRADTPLGAALIDEGLALAPTGTTMPPPPEPTVAIWDVGPSKLMLKWLGMPAALRAQARLVTPGGRDPAGLVFAPGVQPQELVDYARKVEEGYFIEPAADLVLARATETIVLRDEPGAKADAAMVLPPGSLLPVAIGTVDRTPSGLGAKHWSYVGSHPWGLWAPGRSLVADERCVQVDAVREGGELILHGISELAHAGTTQRVMWLVYTWKRPARLEMHVHPLDGCSMGTRTRTLAIGPRATGLHFTPTLAEGGDTLVIAVVEEHEYTHARTVLVFGPGSDEPILRRVVPDGVVEAGLARGPGGAEGWFPLALGGGKTRVWLAWNGTALEERTASPTP